MPNGRIYLISQEPGALVAMSEQDFLTEDQMQSYLADYPDLLPGDQIDPENPRRWLLVKREMGVPSAANAPDQWSLDHLFLDQDGIPTFVECKRAKNTQIRREVVAQMLEYAANGLAYWDIEQLKKAVDVTSRTGNTSSDLLIRQLVNTGSDTAVEDFWRNVEHNLQEGQVRLLFVAERIPRELRRLVEFLNKRLHKIDVMAIELKLFVANGQTALVPNLIGMTEEARIQKETQQRLDRERFLAKAAFPAASTLLEHLLDEAPRHRLAVAWHPTCFSLKVPLEGRSAGIVYAFSDRIEVYFPNLRLPATEVQSLRGALLTLTPFWRETETMLRLPLDSTALTQGNAFVVGLLTEIGKLAQRHTAP